MTDNFDKQDITLRARLLTRDDIEAAGGMTDEQRALAYDQKSIAIMAALLYSGLPEWSADNQAVAAEEAVMLWDEVVSAIERLR